MTAEPADGSDQASTAAGSGVADAKPDKPRPPLFTYLLILIVALPVGYVLLTIIQELVHLIWIEGANDLSGPPKWLLVLGLPTAAGVAVYPMAVFGSGLRAWRQAHRSAGTIPEIEAAIEAALTASRASRGALIDAARRVRATIRPQLLGIWRARDAAGRSIAAGKDRRYPSLHWAVCNDVLGRYETAAREAAKKVAIEKLKESDQEADIN